MLERKSQWMIATVDGEVTEGKGQWMVTTVDGDVTEGKGQQMVTTVDGEVTQGKGQRMVTTVDDDVIVLVCIYHRDKTLSINSLKDERVISSYSFRSQSIRTVTLTHPPQFPQPGPPAQGWHSPGVALPGVG